MQSLRRVHKSPGMGWRSLAVQTPALIISVLALALSLGGAAYASTQLTGSGTINTSVTFHPITLVNGWVSENSTYGTGNPNVGVVSGVVYLSGSLAQPTPGIQQFATLPLAYRPAHTLYINVYTFNGTTGTLYITKNGFISAAAANVTAGCGGSRNSAQCYTSLAAVSYPKNS
jgi:hypothetical protein